MYTYSLLYVQCTISPVLLYLIANTYSIFVLEILRLDDAISAYLNTRTVCASVKRTFGELKVNHTVIRCLSQETPWTHIHTCVINVKDLVIIKIILPKRTLQKLVNPH
jgi:hypothetical protein